MNLYQVTTPSGTYGFCSDAKNLVWQAAPVIKWMREKPLSYIFGYCEKKGWKVTRVESV